jgi:DNA polymerase-1
MGVRMNRTFKYIAKFPSDKIFNDPFVSFDIETTGLNPRKDTIVGASFCVGNGVGYYTPDWRGLAEAIARSNSQVICHNAVFDYSFIKQQGIEFKQRIHDTMLLADCLDPDRESKGLKDLSVALISPNAITAANKMMDWLKSNNLTKDDLYRAPKEILVPYAAEDAINTYELFKILCQKAGQLKQYLNKHDQRLTPWDYYVQEQIALIPVVVDMQLRGVKLDLEKTAIKRQDLEKRQTELAQHLTEQNKEMVIKAEDILHQRRIDDRLKKNKSGKIKKTPPRVLFNWDSNDHLKLLLLQLYKLPVTKKTMKGNASVDSTFLETIKSQFDWVQELLEYKELKKLTSTYLEGLLERQEGGFIHANYHLAGTATGRFSSSNPNMQNLPKHGGIKSLFVPRPNCKFIYADYSQLELRIAAHLSGDTNLIKAYTEGADLHQQTADIIHATRDQGKTINFAIIYNASGWRIAEIMGWMDGIGLCEDPSGKCNFKAPCEPCCKKRQAAKRGDEIIQKLFGKYKELKLFVDKQQEFMLKHKISLSQFGRMRRLPKLGSEIRSEYNHALKAGFNLPIQSFGASLCKRSMVALYAQGHRIVNQIHDSICVEVPDSNVAQAMLQIKNTMEAACTLKVPLVVEPKILTSFEEK